jgi:tRNA1(Val) A37 N6-methylase TrmN6
MLLVARLPGCAVVGVEAVAASHDLAVRNAARNGISDRFSPRLGDLRDAAVLAAERPFDLVTGAPPFMPRGTGVLPRDEARAAGRFELRGGVEDYVDTAAGHVSPGGRVVILMDGSEGSRARAVAAFTARGLSVRATLTVSPRPQRPPKYRVFEAARAAGGPVEERSLAMRPADGGAFSPEYEAIRVEMDLA